MAAGCRLSPWLVGCLLDVLTVIQPADRPSVGSMGCFQCYGPVPFHAPCMRTGPAVWRAGRGRPCPGQRSSGQRAEAEQRWLAVAARRSSKAAAMDDRRRGRGGRQGAVGAVVVDSGPSDAEDTAVPGQQGGRRERAAASFQPVLSPQSCCSVHLAWPACLRVLFWWPPSRGCTSLATGQTVGISRRGRPTWHRQQLVLLAAAPPRSWQA